MNAGTQPLSMPDTLARGSSERQGLLSRDLEVATLNATQLNLLPVKAVGQAVRHITVVSACKLIVQQLTFHPELERLA